MFRTAAYPVHTPLFAYDYSTPPRTPPLSPSYGYYSPRQSYYTTTSASKGYARHGVSDATYGYNTAYTSPRQSTRYSTDYFSSGHYSSPHSSPRLKTDYVSGSDRKRDGTRHYYRVPVETDSRKHKKYSSSKHKPLRPQYAFDDGYGENEYDYLPRYERYESRPPPYERSYYEARADHTHHDQVPVYTSSSDSSERSRPRRTSYAPKPAIPRRSTTSRKPPPKATAEDARRAGIPAGYSYKNWDPTEEPILLLGSVFDANSLGKWIYDWTVFHFGPATPITEVAGELWLLLIQLAGKIKRAEECRSRIRRPSSRDLVDDFLDAGERLWARFSKLLKICEQYMWKAAKRDARDKKKVVMGMGSGCEFVAAVFGREREMERTEKIMTGMRLWSLRFDANCEEILRNPGA